MKRFFPMDGRVISAFTRVFDALLPAHDERQTTADHFNVPWTKAELSFEPRPCITAMIATEMPAATRPYSTAVAPDWSFKKRFTRLVIAASTVHSLRSESRWCRCFPADPERDER